MRRTDRYVVKGPNSLWQLYHTVPFTKVVKNFLILQLARYTPFIPLKNRLYRRFLGMKIGKKTAFALMAMPDVMFPEKISVGENSIIGYNTTILTHEYLTKEYRLGDVIIGSDVMIGANCTILPGVHIGDGATVGAGSVVHKDIAPGSVVGGNPLRELGKGENS
ncbi:acyltransferase [Salimicrobium flavidum]|uniref:Acetyltransferase (Isoleucine patch superfamily) n=1 Tax=Salimicrobium flavidum TaxID=570947 RepID=A0A1N7J1N0_9BACI|nr:acyltransferase [Salimicrobium flavidum]SIS43230.1 Acetyltransferase (isoleucine patch superfamily) [Salimicrobium flavidum]